MNFPGKEMTKKKVYLKLSMAVRTYGEMKRKKSRMLFVESFISGKTITHR